MNVGCRLESIEDPVGGAEIELKLLYPSLASPAEPLRFGPYSMEAALEAEPAAGNGRLVVISHGRGGTSLTHRGTAMALAREGYVVAMVDHPGNCRRDNSLDGSKENLLARPRHLRLVIDWVFAQGWVPGGAMVVALGHSIGAYSVLALAGGSAKTFAQEEADGVERPILCERDRRLQALVLLAPAVGWFREPGSLAQVQVPVFVRYGSEDVHTPPKYVEFVRERLEGAARMDMREVEGAGHFSFQSPFPASMQRPGFMPAWDPEGFDREGYHAQFNREILAFLESSRSSG